jgi:hypothetical protein
MDHKNFKFIFHNFSGHLFCPSCGKKYLETEVSSLTENNGGYLLTISCSGCNLPVTINILQANFDNTALSGNKEMEEITTDELLEFITDIKEFDGDFRRRFDRIDQKS